MENAPQLPSPTRRGPWIWVMISVALLFLIAVCFLLVVMLLPSLKPGPGDEDDTQGSPARPTLTGVLPAATLEVTELTELVTETATFAPETTVTPAFTSQPTEPSLWMLDPEAVPLFGSMSLLRGFAPDPFITGAQAGGMVDTAVAGLNCFFTTSQPSFTFQLSGGVVDDFLRLYFIPDDGSDTAMAVLTPNQEWLCVDDSSYGSGLDPVVDIEAAASGTYAVWLGSIPDGAYVPGMLYITESIENSP